VERGSDFISILAGVIGGGIQGLHEAERLTHKNGVRLPTELKISQETRNNHSTLEIFQMKMDYRDAAVTLNEQFDLRLAEEVDATAVPNNFIEKLYGKPGSYNGLAHYTNKTIYLADDLILNGQKGIYYYDPFHYKPYSLLESIAHEAGHFDGYFSYLGYQQMTDLERENYAIHFENKYHLLSGKPERIYYDIFDGVFPWQYGGGIYP
jgi:hypothetical protein